MNCLCSVDEYYHEYYHHTCLQYTIICDGILKANIDTIPAINITITSIIIPFSITVKTTINLNVIITH